MACGDRFANGHQGDRHVQGDDAADREQAGGSVRAGLRASSGALAISPKPS
jgi:hypothetical protein